MQVQLSELYFVVHVRSKRFSFATSVFPLELAVNSKIHLWKMKSQKQCQSHPKSHLHGYLAGSLALTDVFFSSYSPLRLAFLPLSSYSRLFSSFCDLALAAFLYFRLDRHAIRVHCLLGTSQRRGPTMDLLPFSLWTVTLESFSLCNTSVSYPLSCKLREIPLRQRTQQAMVLVNHHYLSSYKWWA